MVDKYQMSVAEDKNIVEIAFPVLEDHDWYNATERLEAYLVTNLRKSRVEVNTRKCDAKELELLRNAKRVRGQRVPELRGAASRARTMEV